MTTVTVDHDVGDEVPAALRVLRLLILSAGMMVLVFRDRIEVEVIYVDRLPFLSLLKFPGRMHLANAISDSLPRIREDLF